MTLRKYLDRYSRASCSASSASSLQNVKSEKTGAEGSLSGWTSWNRSRQASTAALCCSHGSCTNDIMVPPMLAAAEAALRPRVDLGPRLLEVLRVVLGDPGLEDLEDERDGLVEALARLVHVDAE